MVAQPVDEINDTDDWPGRVGRSTSVDSRDHQTCSSAITNALQSLAGTLLAFFSNHQADDRGLRTKCCQPGLGGPRDPGKAVESIRS